MRSVHDAYIFCMDWTVTESAKMFIMYVNVLIISILLLWKHCSMTFTVIRWTDTYIFFTLKWMCLRNIFFLYIKMCTYLICNYSIIAWPDNSLLTEINNSKSFWYTKMYSTPNIIMSRLKKDRIAKLTNLKKHDWSCD